MWRAMLAATVVAARAIQSGKDPKEVVEYLQSEHPKIFEAMMQYQGYYGSLLESEDEWKQLYETSVELLDDAEKKPNEE